MRLYLLFSIFYISCNSGSQNNIVTGDSDSLGKRVSSILEDTENPRIIPHDSITIGVLSLKGDATGIIVFIDKGEHELLNLSLDTENVPDSFSPYSLNFDYQHMVLRVIDSTDKFYRIVYNEVTGENAFINRNDKRFKFQNWTTHVLTAFSVDFDASVNQIKKDTTESTSVIPFDSDEFYHPVKIAGDWMRIEWGDEEKKRSGWIKWRSNNRLLINLAYIA